MTPTPRPTFLALCCEEPFRIFFPLGALVGISGVSLWPLYFSGLHKFYPGIMHARLMTEGFLGAFIIGFLGTAGPRLTGTPHFSRVELGVLLALFLGATGTHIGEQFVVGDAIFLVLLVFFIARMTWRFAQRSDLPPPSFILVAFGFFNAILGVVLLLASEMGAGSLRTMWLGSLLLSQGFVLDLILGVGGFLLRRLMLLPARPGLPEGRDLSPLWKRRALFAAGIGAVLLAGFVVEVFLDLPRTAGLIRFAAVASFLATEIPVHRFATPAPTIPQSLRLGLILLLLGLLFPVVWPGQRVAGLHLIFIGGFSLITFTVATRVVLGHSGHGRLFDQPLPFLRGAATLLILAAIFRVMGDFFPLRRGPVLELAGYLWMLAAGIWSWRALPRVRIADPESLS